MRIGKWAWVTLKEKAEKVLQKKCRNEVLLEEERRFWRE